MTDERAARQIRRIVVVSNSDGNDVVSYAAGWQAALVLAHQLNDVDIKIEHICVEPGGRARIAIATVGQEQIDFHNALGIDEAALVSDARGAFVLADRYVGWVESGHELFHSSAPLGVSMKGVAFHHCLTRLHHASALELAADEFSMSASCAKRGKFSHPASDPSSIKSTITYGLNLDAATYAKFLREQAMRFGAVERVGRIEAVHVNDSGEGNGRGDHGFISAIKLQDDITVDGDFFIDCTKDGYLIGQSSGVDWVSWSDTYPATASLRLSGPGNLPQLAANTYETTDFGWSRTRRLQDRVQSDCFFDTNEYSVSQIAEQLNNEGANGRLETDCNEELRPGVRAQFWVGNCLAVSTAAVRVEPVAECEFSHIRADLLRWLKRIPSANCPGSLARTYNRHTRAAYDDVRDYNRTFFGLCAWRDSSFWRKCGELDASEQLQQNLRLFGKAGVIPQYEHQTVPGHRWASLLVGMKQWPQRYDPLLEQFRLDDVNRQVHRLGQNMAGASSRQLSHVEYLREYCGRPVAASLK